MTIIRSILAVLAGVVVAVAIIFVVEAAGHHVYPPPPGFDMHDPAALRAVAASLPAGVFAFVVAAWALGTFAGAWVAARIAGRTPVAHGLIVGAVLLAAAVANMLTIPHPVWVWVAGTVVTVVCGYAGGSLAAHRSQAT